MAKKKVTTQTLSRPPVVTIMGHVDHGKTTILDTIRKTHVAAGEHGGITQHIGAYQAFFNQHPITFIDTPGHAAFMKMRARGANVTDIVILVVAANDGVKPQTVESIRLINEAKVPFVVAINKVDLPDITIERVKGELAEHQVFCEGYGGQVPYVEVSGKTGLGIDRLLETVLIMAELEEFKTDPSGEPEAVIIESNLDKHRGPIATVIVKKGTLKPGLTVYLEAEPVKIRQLLNEQGRLLDQVKPGEPCVVIGFKTVPPVGAIISGQPRAAVSPPPVPAEPAPVPIPADTTETPADAGEPPVKPHFNLILKADTAGTLEAILNNVTQDEITLVNSGVGPINESDILLAKDAKAVIIGFNIIVTPPAARLVEIEGVRLKTFSIIYELLEYLEDKVLELLEPTIFELVLGSAEVKQVFQIRGSSIAGSEVLSGKVTKGDQVHLVHRGRILKNAKIASLKQGKSDIKSATAGEACGIVVDPPFDFRLGDVIKSYRLTEK